MKRKSYEYDEEWSDVWSPPKYVWARTFHIPGKKVQRASGPYPKDNLGSPIVSHLDVWRLSWMAPGRQRSQKHVILDHSCFSARGEGSLTVLPKDRATNKEWYPEYVREQLFTIQQQLCELSTLQEGKSSVRSMANNLHPIENFLRIFFFFWWTKTAPQFLNHR